MTTYRPETIEQIAEAVHLAWMNTKRGQGVTSRPSEWGEEQMVPYGDLSASCDHPAHLAEMLQQAGLLADATPPVTPTTRVLAERADRTAPCCNAHHFEGCADGEPGCCPRCSINPWPTERTDGRTT